MNKRKPAFISLNFKVFALAIAMALIPMGIIGTLLYQKALDIVRQKQEAASLHTLNSISENIGFMTEYAHSLSLFIIQNDDVNTTLKTWSMTEEERVRHQNQVIKSLLFYTGQNQFVSSIYIEGKNGLSLSSGDVSRVRPSADRKLLAEELQGRICWMGTGEKDGDGNVEYLTLLRSIRDIENPGNTLGIQEINIPISRIKDQFRDYTEVYPGYIALMAANGEILLNYGEGKEQIEIEHEKDGGWTPRSGKNILIQQVPVADTGWTLLSGINVSLLLAENRTIRNLLLIGIVISALLCILITYTFSRSILRPLRLLTNNIKEIKEDNYHVQLDFTSNDEIGVLSSQFNAMTRRMDELVNEVLTGKVLQTQAELTALQAQVDPHFLYNNLNTAYWMSRLEGAEQTGKVVLAIADLYRLTLNSGHKLISVETEIRYLDNYILIQELRVSDQIHFHRDIDAAMEKWATMRFVIQPLVENSIQHGILPTGREGNIWVRVYRDENILYFEVEDDGDATDTAELEALLKDTKSDQKRGMAIRNIDQRIKLQFGQEYGLFFSISENGGTLAKVVQPLQEHDNHAPASFTASSDTGTAAPRLPL